MEQQAHLSRLFWFNFRLILECFGQDIARLTGRSLGEVARGMVRRICAEQQWLVDSAMRQLIAANPSKASSAEWLTMALTSPAFRRRLRPVFVRYVRDEMRKARADPVQTRFIEGLEASLRRSIEFLFSIPRSDSASFWTVIGVEKENPHWIGAMFEVVTTGAVENPARWRRLLGLLIRRVLWQEHQREREPDKVICLVDEAMVPARPPDSDARDPQELIGGLGLPPKQQQAVELQWEADQSGRELEALALERGLNPATVRSNLRHARAKLRP